MTRGDGYTITVRFCPNHLPLLADMLQHITRPHKPDAVMIHSREPTLLFVFRCVSNVRRRLHQARSRPVLAFL